MSPTATTPPTERLEQDDASVVSFDGRVVAHASWSGRPSVVLHQSAFYPESGGQMADRGTLAGRAVLDVQIDDAGLVHHVLGGSLPAIGEAVHGDVDAERRRVHRALHSAQHLLSRALVDVCGAETASSRLGETLCTVDVDRSGLAEGKVAEAEAAVLAVVDRDRPVRAWFPSAEELLSLPLRRAPKQHDRIRVVDLGGFDVSPCGGTHVSRTAQIGLCRVLGVERYKGGTRVSFSAGARARSELFAESKALAAAGAALVVPRLGVPDAITRLEARLKDTQGQLGRARAVIAKDLADRARATATEGRAVLTLDEGGAELARVIAEHLTKEGGLVVIVGAVIESGLHVVVARGPASTVDCGALLRELAQKSGGKGGGRPERAEGRLPTGTQLSTLATQPTMPETAP